MSIEQIKEKIRIGDYITLGEVLGITPDNARMRFRRERKDAVEAMIRVIESRERLVGEIKT